MWPGGSYLYDGVFRGCPGRHDLAVQPPAAVGVDHVPLEDHVLQHVLGLVLAAQQEASKAVVEGQDLEVGRPGRTGELGARQHLSPVAKLLSTGPQYR